MCVWGGGVVVTKILVQPVSRFLKKATQIYFAAENLMASNHPLFMISLQATFLYA